MKKTLRMPPIHRSLVGQTTLLSLGLLLLALAYFVFLPLLNMDRPDPLESTVWTIRSAVLSVVDKAETPLSAVRGCRGSA